MSGLLFLNSSDINLQLSVVFFGKQNNRSESLSGYLPQLELKYLDIKLFLVTAFATVS